MTRDELNTVRDLQEEIKGLEKHLSGLRTKATNIVPILDGLPHSHEAQSRVEKIALEIVEDEVELVALRGKLPLAKATLMDKILEESDGDPLLETLLILRYVECCSFRETARRMFYSLRAIFKMHRNYLEKLN